MLLKLSERKRRWLGFISVVSAIALIFTDQSILPVAIPTIQRDFQTTSFQTQWMINAYFLSMSIFILASGTITDIIGRRRIFLLGLSTFLFASLFCAIAMNSIWLISFRVVQGIGGAMMIPSSYAILLDLFPADKRGFAVGLNTAVGSFFLVAAPYIGGVFTQYLSWRWVFWINIPICFVGQIFAILAIEKPEIEKEKFDFKGFFLFALFMLCFILAFMQAKEWGWISPGIILLFIFAIIFFIFFVTIVKKNTKNPFLDFSLFKSKGYKIVSMIIILIVLAFSITIFWPIYYQYLLSFSPTKAGIASLIGAAPVMIMAPVAGNLMDRFSPKLPIIIGLFLLLFAFIWFTIFFKTGSLMLLMPGLLMLGAGASFAFTPAFAYGITSVPNKIRGMATGVLGTFRNGGLAIGIAVFGSVILNVEHLFFSHDLEKSVSTSKLTPAMFDGLLAKAPEALDALNKLPKNVQEIVKNGYFTSSMSAFLIANIIAGSIIFLLIIYVLISFKTKKKKRAN
ncbi:MAG: Multidrug resistance protein Stp [Candidatus Anoxychlamydiales bacterium]|nr:Multidrug resistance protein Stp [Candidatus Anoxychlamydiales bacterium]